MHIALRRKEYLTSCKNYHMAKYSALAIIFWGKWVTCSRAPRHWQCLLEQVQLETGTSQTARDAALAQSFDSIKFKTLLHWLSWAIPLFRNFWPPNTVRTGPWFVVEHVEPWKLPFYRKSLNSERKTCCPPVPPFSREQLSLMLN